MSDLEPKDEIKQGFSDMQYYYTELSNQIRKVHSEFRGVDEQFRKREAESREVQNQFREMASYSREVQSQIRQTQSDLRAIQSQLRDNHYQFIKAQTQNDNLRSDIKNLPWIILTKVVGAMALLSLVLAGIIISQQVAQ